MPALALRVMNHVYPQVVTLMWIARKTSYHLRKLAFTSEIISLDTVMTGTCVSYAQNYDYYVKTHAQFPEPGCSAGHSSLGSTTNWGTPKESKSKSQTGANELNRQNSGPSNLSSTCKVALHKWSGAVLRLLVLKRRGTVQ
jgi:hypothetical protein